MLRCDVVALEALSRPVEQVAIRLLWIDLRAEYSFCEIWPLAVVGAAGSERRPEVLERLRLRQDEIFGMRRDLRKKEALCVGASDAGARQDLDAAREKLHKAQQDVRAGEEATGGCCAVF